MEENLEDLLSQMVYFQRSGRIGKLHQEWAGVPVRVDVPCFQQLARISRSHVGLCLPKKKRTF
jgi:hypothetical protein